LTAGVGFWPAAILLSLGFGALHLENPGENWVGILAAMLIGFFFCLTLRRTGNLWFAIGFHASWDWGESYLYSVPNSGWKPPGHLLHSSLQGPRWLSGGSVGPEGSVFLFVLLALLWVVFDRVYPEVKYPETRCRRLQIRIRGSLQIENLQSEITDLKSAACKRAARHLPALQVHLPGIVHGVGDHLLAVRRDGYGKLHGLRVRLARLL
jgi:hypothetical protein